ncbi:MAG: hypothetical protein CMH13_09105 [Martelella sp.]|uniref:hypothetical protein n=1 Tax=unclassified Martelella TaxID=2629616 RepID=UPI000C5E9898|nr:hypothetical protein [Martelella sp.]MAU20677.1 hypothetical protein [Martelella sp.]|tara:strand:- start:446 stop:1087 length:642 start_codon:yes stop_codon:yes gene_type:complete
MRLLKFNVTLLTFFAGLVVSAQAYDTKQTNHFGFTTTDIDNNFKVAAMCTVSGGSSEELLDSAADWLPAIGSTLMGGIKWAALDKGEVLCGLRHYEGPGAFTFPADTKGFELTIRAYQDGNQIGKDLSPRNACNNSLPFRVNMLGACWEKGEKRSLDRKEADYVVACIETEVPSSNETLSFLVYAGSAPQEIETEVASQATNVLKTGCAQRTF